MTTSTSLPPPLPAQVSPELSAANRTLAALCHISVWLNALFFGLGFVIPLVVFLVMRDQSRFVALNAKEVLNFQLSMLIYLICSFPLFMIIIGAPIMLGVILLVFIGPLIGTVRAADGTLALYPLTIRFF
jgi:uncharacterized Tic20 family protein